MNSQWHVYTHKASEDAANPGLPQAASLLVALEKIENADNRRVHTVLYMGYNTFWILSRVELGEQMVMDHALGVVAEARSEGKQAA